MARRVLAVGLALVVLVGIVVAGRAVWQRLDRSPLQAALGMVDEQALRVSFTDWKQVRAAVDRSPEEDPDDWIDRGDDLDLTAASSIDGSARALQLHFGFSPENADWEAFAQGREGAAMVLKLDGEVDFSSLADNLAEIGFEAPDEDDGVWLGGIDLIAQLDGTLTPQVQYVALHEDERVVVTSDTREQAALVSEVVRGDRPSLASTGADDLAGHAGDPDAAVLWAGDFACEDLSMATASEEDQTLAEQLIASAGEITPVTGVVIALGDDQLTVAEQFPDADQAETNLRSRAELAVGPAVGRTDGTFDDDLELVSSTASGDTIVLEFTPRGDYPLSRHSSGALVFASC